METILPSAFHPELELIADHPLVETDELFLKAAQLDRSVALQIKDYLAIAKPRKERIVA